MMERIENNLDNRETRIRQIFIKSKINLGVGIRRMYGKKLIANDIFIMLYDKDTKTIYFERNKKGDIKLKSINNNKSFQISISKSTVEKIRKIYHYGRKHTFEITPKGFKLILTKVIAV